MSQQEQAPERHPEWVEAKRAQHQQEKALHAEMYALMRGGRFDAAEATLLNRLDASGCTLFDAVREAQVTSPPATAGLWIGDLIDAARRAPKERPLTAIEIGFSNAGVPGAQDQPAYPDIEVTGYTDEYFPFSTASDADFLEVFQDHATPWQGCFDWFPGRRSRLEGLETANRVLLNQKHLGDRGSGLVVVGGHLEVALEAKAEVAANLLLAVKFHRFMRDAMAKTVVPIPLVVIVDGNDEVHIRAIHHRPPRSDRCDSRKVR